MKPSLKIFKLNSVLILTFVLLTLSNCSEKSKEPSVETTNKVPLASETKIKPKFKNVASQAGLDFKNLNGEEIKKIYLIESEAGGCAFLDFNNDGFLDVYLTNGTLLNGETNGGNRLYKNNGDETFTDISESSGTDSKSWSMGVAVADYDSDGDLDIYVTNYGENQLFRNNGDETFTEVGEKAGINVGGWSTGVAFGDYDNDGDLDLYVANYVNFVPENTPKPGETKFGKWKGLDVIVGPQGLEGESDFFFENNGDGTFTDKTKEANLLDSEKYYGFSVVWQDLNGDGWLDLYIANDSTPNLIYFNQKDKTFQESGIISGVAYNEDGKEQAGMGVAIGDFNADTKPDIFVTNFSDDTNTLYQNDGKGFFSDVTFQAGLGESSLKFLSWGTDFVDFDNDGDDDIFISNGHIYPEAEKFDFNTKFFQENQVYENLGNSTFRDISNLVGLSEKKSSRGASFGDFNNDGNIDVLVLNLNDLSSLYQNENQNGNNFISVQLVGEGKNTFAVGSLVEIYANGVYSQKCIKSGSSFISQSDFRLHFGVAKNTKIDKIVVNWATSNKKSIFENIESNSFVKIYANDKIEVKAI